MLLVWLMLSGLLIIVLALLRHPRAHLPQLVPLIALLPIATYLSYGRGAALSVAMVLMGLTVVLEISRLVSPRWNRALAKRVKPFIDAREAARPFSVSSAAVGVALLVALASAPVAFVAALVGIVVPSLRGTLAHDLKLLGRARRFALLRPRVAPYLAVVLAVALVALLVAPAAGAAWWVVVLACAGAGVATVLPIPIDAYLLAPVAAAAILLLA